MDIPTTIPQTKERQGILMKIYSFSPQFLSEPCVGGVWSVKGKAIFFFAGIWRLYRRNAMVK